MTPQQLTALLERVRSGELNIDDAVGELRNLPFRELGDDGGPYATIDHHRAVRRGFPEVVFGLGKGLDELSGIVKELVSTGGTVLVTRVNAEQAARLREEQPAGEFHERARTFLVRGARPATRMRGSVCVVTAGTSDLPVADEAAVCLEAFGNDVVRVTDVGVAGIQRTLNKREVFAAASVVIVVAGMEGALPSVVAGLIDRPVIAVPTSIGYGANYGGLAALLGMLNSCAAGVTVVNIDNGFGAAYAATLMNRELE